MKKAIIFAAMLTFGMQAAEISYWTAFSDAATSTTWKFNKKDKAWTVKTKKLKSTLEIIRDFKKN